MRGCRRNYSGGQAAPQPVLPPPQRRSLDIRRVGAVFGDRPRPVPHILLLNSRHLRLENGYTLIHIAVLMGPSIVCILYTSETMNHSWAGSNTRIRPGMS